MHDPLNPHDLVHDEIDQARETGHLVDELSAELAALDPGDAIALEALYQRVLSAPRSADWGYEEPDGFDAILASLPPDPPQPAPLGAELENKIRGGWLGRIAGCNLGKPVEAGDHWTSAHLRDYLERAGAWPLRGYIPALDPMPDGFVLRDNWVDTTRGRVRGSARDDDIDYAILGLHLLEQHGDRLTPQHVADAWLGLLPYLQTYTAERATYRSLLNGVPVEAAGSTRNPYREWIGALIRGDAFGWTHPGRPREAIRLAYQDASLSHTANGIYGELWAAAIVASAFTASTVREAFDRSLRSVPPGSRLYETLTAVRDLRDSGVSWETALATIQQRWGFYSWVHTVNNAALIAAGLLWGDDDYATTVGLTVQGGWDTDSNGATAGSVVGVVLGAARLPEHFIAPLEDRTRSALFGYDNSVISELARRTVALATAGAPAAHPATQNRDPADAHLAKDAVAMRGRPRYHITAPENWLNDPCGPLYWNGQYHMYYQYNPDAPRWGLMRWGHTVSDDLVHWVDRGVAMRPTPDGADVDGCWSGCARIIDGQPVFFYTGVTGTGAGQAQAVLRAVGDESLDHLRAEPATPIVPAAGELLGTRHQRDPFLIRYEDRWIMLLGTGLRTTEPGGRGAVVAWESSDTLTWSYRGVVYSRAGGRPRPGEDPFADVDTGPVWECPQLIRVDGAWVLIVSAQLPLNVGVGCPYAAWFIGEFDGERFEPTSMGLMDAGDVFYAPAVAEGVPGRTLVWGWIQEGEGGPADGFAGALSLPRELAVAEGRLLMRPAAELDALWGPPLYEAETLGVTPDRPVRLAEGIAPAYRLRFESEPGAGRAGARLGRNGDGDEFWVGVSAGRLVTGVLHGDDLAERHSVELPSGGSDPTAITVYVDHSVVEIFTADGSALTCRVYPELDCSGGIWLDSTSAEATFRRIGLATTKS